MRAHTGLVTPSPFGPHVEQVGWGVARQVVRVLREAGITDAWLDDVIDLAEEPGHLVYAVFERRTTTALAWVTLGEGVATYEADVLTDDARSGTRAALVVRALHDVAQHGIDWLELPDLPDLPDQPGWDPSSFA